MYKSLKHNPSSCLKSVWGVLHTPERRQISSGVTNTSPFYSAGFVPCCPGAPKSSDALVPRGTRRGSKSTQTKIEGKKMPPLLLCHDLTLSSCVPSKKNSTRAELYPLPSFYVSPAGAVFEGFCRLRFVRISVNPIHAPASPGSPETMLIMLLLCFQTWEATKSLTAARRHHNSQTLHQRLPRSLNVQKQGQPHARVLPMLEKSQTSWC